MNASFLATSSASVIAGLRDSIDPERAGTG